MSRPHGSVNGYRVRDVTIPSSLPTARAQTIMQSIEALQEANRDPALPLANRAHNSKLIRQLRNLLVGRR